MSRQQFTEEEKAVLAARYHNGDTVQMLAAKTGIPRSTLYYWINKHRPLKSSAANTVSYKEYLTLKRHAQKPEQQLAVLRAVGCGLSAPLQEKLEALAALHGQYSVHVLCSALDVSRGTFYNHVYRCNEVAKNDQRRAELSELIRSVFEENKQRFGPERIRVILAERGVRTSREYVAALMQEMGLQCLSHQAKKEYSRQSQTDAVRRNVLQRRFDVTAPNLVWVSDVTCFKLKDKYYYICVIIDLFSRRVIAYTASLKNSTQLITSTFKKAFELRGKHQGLTFHSDQGAQYTANTFCKLLRMNKVVQSFSHPGKPHDNAVAEAFFATMKKEELYRTNYKSENDLLGSIDEYLCFYNEKRPHKSLAYKTPARFESDHDEKNGL